jgi:hypothetical protein
MIHNFFSVLFKGIFISAFLAVIGLGTYLYKQKDNYLYKEDVVVNEDVLGEATVSLDGELESMEITLEETGTATLVLDEFETEQFIKSFISNSKFKWIPLFQDDFYLDFASNGAFLHSRGVWDVDVTVQIIAEKTDSDSYYPKIENIMYGPLSTPSFISEKLDDIIYQAVEQMKTEGFGGRKISKFRFMQDKVIIVFDKV